MVTTLYIEFTFLSLHTTQHNIIHWKPFYYTRVYPPLSFLLITLKASFSYPDRNATTEVQYYMYEYTHPVKVLYRRGKAAFTNLAEGLLRRLIPVCGYEALVWLTIKLRLDMLVLCLIASFLPFFADGYTTVPCTSCRSPRAAVAAATTTTTTTTAPSAPWTTWAWAWPAARATTWWGAGPATRTAGSCPGSSGSGQVS